MTTKFYITTAIDYVNSLPHLGTAYEKIGADALARFFRMEGRPVHFQMGNDEHSTNVKKEADRRGLAPKVYCDEMRKKFEAIWKSLEISYNGFIQTSEPRHHAAVKKFISLLRPGDLYTAPYEGWYCESCEAFLTEKDLVDGKCPTHKTEPKWLKEKNYFFALSKYQQPLLEHYARHPEFILPEIRRNEIMSLVKSGLQDTSISRASFPWGIPFPNDPTHVVYVWFDALINYLTAVGFGSAAGATAGGTAAGGTLRQASRRGPADFKKWWPADLHIIGKDITRFHAVIWPAMLMSAGLPLPRTVFGHGFVFLKGEKMSKTLGNVVTPLDIVPKFGADVLRYYLLRESSFGSDGDFTWENFIKRYNSDLANDLGNLLNRSLGMVNKYLKGKVSKPVKAEKVGGDLLILKTKVLGAIEKLREAVDWRRTGDIEFHRGLEAVWGAIGAADKYIDTAAPWKIAADGSRTEKGKNREINAILYRVVDSIRNIAILIAPFLPQTSQEIWKQLSLSKKMKWEKQTFKNIVWGATPSVTVTAGRPIFPRIEPSGGKEAGLTTDSSSPTSLPAGNSPLSPASLPTKESTMEIDITEFQKIDLRVAEVKQAERIEGTDKLLKLQIDIGGESRQVVAGIALHYKPEELIGKKIVVVANLKPATIRGVESRGMLLAASTSEGLSILTLDRPLSPGAKVK